MKTEELAEKLFQNQSKHIKFIGAFLVGDFQLVISHLELPESFKFIKNLYTLITTTESEFDDYLSAFDKETEYDILLKEIVALLKKTILKDISQLLGGNKDKLSGNKGNLLENKTKKLLEDEKLLKNILKLLHCCKFKVLTKGYALMPLLEITSTLTGVLEGKMNESFQNLLKALTGVDMKKLTDSKSTIISKTERIELMLKSLLQIFFPDLIPSFNLILNFLHLGFSLTQSQASPQKLHSELANLAQQIGFLFGVNSHDIHGIIGIVKGDVNAIVKMAAPIANIPPHVLYYIILYLFFFIDFRL